MKIEIEIDDELVDMCQRIEPSVDFNQIARTAIVNESTLILVDRGETRRSLVRFAGKEEPKA